MVVTEDEKQVLSSLGVKNVWVIPNIHEEISLSEKVAFDQRSGLVFIGSYNHPPNIDAVKWLCLEIMPLVWASRPFMSLPSYRTSTFQVTRPGTACWEGTGLPCPC